ncbi:MAG TPA: hypothetical protein VF476_17440, partial [Chitinophagaceae bacterium]
MLNNAIERGPALLKGLILFLLLSSFAAVAQKSTTILKPLKEEQAMLSRNIKQSAIDSVITYPLSRFAESEINNIYSSITGDRALTALEKEKASQSLLFLVKELNQRITKERNEVYDVSGALIAYKNVLQVILYHRPFTQLVAAVGPRQSQVLAAAFSNYKEYQLLDDMAVYKRVASQPQFIMQFLETKPQFRFADSLVLLAATYDPARFAAYVNHRSGLQSNIMEGQNPYLKQYFLLSEHKQASELLPFVIQITEKKLSTEDILQTRMDVTKYFQLLVNTIKETKASKDSSSIFLNLLRRGIKEKSIAFYVNQVNDLHDAAEATRFASVKGLRPEDIYYIITSAGEELYTSSYLGLYKRLMENYKTQPADSLFELVQYDNFRTFMRLAANYNVLVDFLSSLSQEKAMLLIKRFIGGIEGDTDAGLEKAMDIADSFTGLETSPEMAGLMRSELQTNLKRCKNNHQYLGVRLYSILLQVFDLVRKENNFNPLWTTLGNYEVLKRNVLEDKQ